MLRVMLKSKIHRATVTEADLSYEGSLTIDADLMRAANILPYEMVHIFNIANGERFQTYAIDGEAGSGVMCLNGAAARKGTPGDLIIIATFATYDDAALEQHQPQIVLVDSQNRQKKAGDKPWKNVAV
ncbi:MAG: aspartate 1-decarboxylase [Syntrophales bacterium]|nr:aspartate 1-decarboxylase [Syntrophales bacterium]MDD5640957.1 aspartate 1-decarboxylase [Syntrophales bacterium]